MQTLVLIILVLLLLGALPVYPYSTSWGYYAPLPLQYFLTFMKTLHKLKDHTDRGGSRDLTLGDLIASTYTACGARQAPKILQLAIDTQLIRFKRPVS